MHITNEADIELRKRFQRAQSEGTIPPERTFKLGKRSVKPGGKTEFFAVDDQGKEYPELGTVVGIVTVCG